MDNNNVNVPNTDMNNTQIPNNSVNNVQVPNTNQNVSISASVPVEAPNISNVVPPSVGNNEFKVNEEDGKILMPVVEQPIQPDPIIAPTVENVEPVTSNDNNNIMENKRMEKVEIEYVPPTKFKTAMMVLMFLIVLAAIIFMPDITKYVELLKNPPEPEVNNEVIQNGSMSCGLETSDEKYNYIYSGDFSFENRQLKNLTYSLTTKGDRVLDSTELTLMYNNCKALSTELTNKPIGVMVNCDLYDGTLKVDESIDYSQFVLKDAEELFNKYAIKLADFEADENIGDIENELKKSNYICTMEAKSE